MIVKYDGLAAWAFAFLKIVPLALKRAIVKFFVGFNSHGSVVEAAVELCQPYIWSNICHMTHSEMKIVCPNTYYISQQV
jgi:hypothetical protein